MVTPIRKNSKIHLDNLSFFDLKFVIFCPIKRYKQLNISYLKIQICCFLPRNTDENVKIHNYS